MLLKRNPRNATSSKIAGCTQVNITAYRRGAEVSSKSQESEKVVSNSDTLMKSAATETTRQPSSAPAMVSMTMEILMSFNLKRGASSFRAMIQNTTTMSVSTIETPRKLSKPGEKMSVSL